ncbi:hypothetical protein A3Q56_08544 [Intoshia linei]|uniref:CBS domain-containing protein n=1 Tax=Intoshia linei TaxID=1819745 RepID=A0A177AP04_9BILA|nr:hypothetical protein A3Q56_08544 [Intoshia linei]
MQPIMDTSSLFLDKEYSLRRCNILINNMGINTICIVDEIKRVVGIISRQDMMYHHMQDKLQSTSYSSI